MKTFGLTGGIGMGKSAAADLLQQHGIPVIDTDLLARQLVEPGQPALEEIRQAFGPDILSPSGELRRDILAERVFSDPAGRGRLEAILHPLIRARWRQRTMELERAGGTLVAVVVIPLLFETGAEVELDRTVCVACSTATQARRLAPRGWSQAQVRQRLAAQYTIDQKMVEADFVIWNEAGLDVLWEQCARILGSA